MSKGYAQKRKEVSEYREIVKDLVKKGLSMQEIAKMTGLSVQTASRYREELEAEEGYVVRRTQKKEKTDIRPDFEKDWTNAVNRIRKYLGKELFPMPQEG